MQRSKRQDKKLRCTSRSKGKTKMLNGIQKHNVGSVNNYNDLQFKMIIIGAIQNDHYRVL